MARRPHRRSHTLRARIDELLRDFDAAPNLEEKGKIGAEIRQAVIDLLVALREEAGLEPDQPQDEAAPAGPRR